MLHAANIGETECGVFTGIIEEIGEVVAIEQLSDAARLTIRGPLVVEDAAQGDSIAVNGVCLTVIQLPSADTFQADVMGETLASSSIGTLRTGSVVNLERAVPVTGRFGGHIVQGHVDGTGTVVTRESRDNWDVLRIALPAPLARQVTHKGSIAVDGVSLTVSGVGGQQGPAGTPWFEVCLIPTTLSATTLGKAAPGTTVNLETDVIAKYVDRLRQHEGVSSRSDAGTTAQ